MPYHMPQHMPHMHHMPQQMPQHVLQVAPPHDQSDVGSQRVCYTAAVSSPHSASSIGTWIGINSEHFMLQWFLESILNVTQVCCCCITVCDCITSCVLLYVTKQPWTECCSFVVCSQMRHSCSCRVHSVFMNVLTPQQLNSQSTFDGAQSIVILTLCGCAGGPGTGGTAEAAA